MNSLNTRKVLLVSCGSVVTSLVVFACATPLVPEDVRLRPSALVAGSSTTMNATVGTTLQNQPSVIVRDQHGDPLPSVTVSFTASSGTQPTPTSKETDDQGRASPTSWTLPTASGSVTLTASVPSTTLAAQLFTVTLNPGPATQAAPASSSGSQSAVAGTAVPIAPQVLVRDQHGNPVPGVAVTFSVTGGGGTVVPTTAVNTDANGVARATSWTLGTALGTNTLRATVAGITTPVTFTATGTAGTPTSIVVGGDGSSQGQTAVANTKVANAPIVLVRDVNNNPVPNINVRFTIAGGAGRILTSSTDTTGQTTVDVTTGAAGTASIFAWRLGSTGANTLSAELPAHTSVSAFVFSATGIIGPPTQVAVSNQAWGYTQSGTVHLGSPSVVVRDAGNNLVPNATVNWTTPDAKSTLSGTASSTTSSTGIAAFPRSTVNWTAAGAVGDTMSLVATVSGTSLTSTFKSKIVGVGTTLTKHAGDNQSGSVNTALAIRPAVKIVDAAGDPVPGTSISFAVTLGGGTVTGTPALADSVGISTVGSWTLGSTVGTNNNTMRASLSSASTTFVDFTASATAGAPASVTAKSGNPTSSPVNSEVQVTVIVRDAASNLVAGASVQFTPTNTPGNAAIIGTNPVITGANGEATATWRLDTLARTNTASAVTNSVGTNLSVTGTALAASKLTIVAGNDQTASPSTTLPIQPTVKVSDQYNNAVPSQSVTWAPAHGTVNCGAGATASCTSTSASTGNAVTSWTLGSSTGTQTLQASLTATPTVTASFTATASSGCTNQAYTLGTTVNGSLASGDCGSTSSPINYYDRYRFTSSGTTVARFTLKPSGYIGRLTGWFWPTANAGWGSVGAVAGDSVTLYAIFAGATYDMDAAASTATSGATGSYQFLSQVNPTLPAGWCSFQITKGASHANNLSSTNCLYMSTNSVTGTNRSSRTYYVSLATGTSMSVSMAGALDNYIEVYDISGTRTFVTFADAGGAGATETVNHSNSSGSTKFYEIRATHWLSGSSDTPKSGTFTLSIAP